jgi:hypothetical protein
VHALLIKDTDVANNLECILLRYISFYWATLNDLRIAGKGTHEGSVELIFLQMFFKRISMLTEHLLVKHMRIWSTHLMQLLCMHLQSSVKVLMPPPTTRGCGSTSNATVGNKLRSSSSSHLQMGKRARYSQLSSSTSEEHVRAQTRGSSSSTIFENVKTTTLDIQRSKPKRKRRPKKKKTT